MTEEVDYVQRQGRPSSDPVVLLDFLQTPRPPGSPLSEPILDNTVSHELLETWPIKCAFAVQEMLTTEKNYVKDLYDIIQGYRIPLSDHLGSDNEGHQVISTLFCNVEEIFNLHKWVLDSLITNQADPHALGQVFVTSIDKFKIYSEYCTNYDSALACLRALRSSSKDMDQFLRECQHNLGHALPLSSQLIKPVQRIMRYHMMLKAVVKHFDGNHHGYHSLDSAHREMVRIGNYINKVKKQKENQERVEDLQCNTTGWTGKNMTNLSAYGELIIEDSCKVGHRGLKRQVVLFENLLLIVKKKDIKKYTYKAHIGTSELHIHDNFSELHPSKFKVSSLIHRHQNYVVDFGSPKKQREWREKMHALICRVEQAKMGRLLSMPATTVSAPPKKPPPLHPVKRRRIEEDSDSGLPELELAETIKEKGSSSTVSIRSRASRVLSSKKRARGDVRDLFSEESIPSPKLQSYSPQITTSCPPVMQTIPELGVPPQPEAPPSDDTTDPTPCHLELVSELESSPLKPVASSTSMDSLSDVDFGMEEQAGVTEETDGRRVRKPGISKRFRRAAIKVKRKAGAVLTWNSSDSTSSLLKAREREAREASRSPLPIEGEGLSVEEDTFPEEQDSLLPFILDKMQGAPSGSSDLSSIFSVQDSSLYSMEVGDASASATPVPALPEQAQDSGVVSLGTDGRMEEEEEEEEEGGAEQLYLADADPQLSLSPFKRPRSLSHEQEGQRTHRVEILEQAVQVEIVLGDDDELELGESCGQAKMRGRATMPVYDPAVDERSLEVAEWEFSGTGSGSLEQSSSSYLGEGVGDMAEVEGMDADFMIVEDSSDSEEEESVEDFEVTGDELEVSLLEAVEAGEASLPQQSQETRSLASPTSDIADQVVPGEEALQKSWVMDENAPAEGADFADFFSTLNESNTVQSPDSDKTPAKASTPVFHFEASPGNKRDIDIYGTLPHKKKAAARSVSVPPLKSGSSPLKSASQDPVRSSVRRAEGFSRLLEFTRQQQFQPETCQLVAFDMTQSMPVHTNMELCDIEESEGEDQSESLEAEDEVCLLETLQTTGANEDEFSDLCLLNSTHQSTDLHKDEVVTEEGGNTLPELSDREIVPEEQSDQQEVAASLDSREESTVEVVGSEASAPIAPTGHTDIEEGSDIAPTGHTDIEERSDASRDSVLVMDAFVDQSAESPTNLKLGAASQASVAGEISDTTVPIPDNTVSPWRSAEVDELPHEEVTSARTEGVVQQRNGSLGDLSLWRRALLTRLANFLPSRAGVLAFGVGMTAFFVFFAISGYFK